MSSAILPIYTLTHTQRHHQGKKRDKGEINKLRTESHLANEIEKLIRDFLWSGTGDDKKDHLVSWDMVFRTKANGGLGLGCRVFENISPVGKSLLSH